MADKHLPHLFLTKPPTTERFTSTQAGGGGPNLKARDRDAHGKHLRQELAAAIDVPVGAAPQTPLRGVSLEFRSEPGFDLLVKSLEAQRIGIELLGVKEEGEVTVATVYVPDGRIGHFEKLIDKYLDATKHTKTGKPFNRPLVESIAGIRRAAVESFWTDDPAVYPQPGESARWEVWLRGRREDILEDARTFAKAAGVRLSKSVIDFPDRCVVLAVATPQELAASVQFIDCVAELRRAKETAHEFLHMSPDEQGQWAKDLVDRVSGPEADAPVVCLLDTGVTRTHTLLSAALPAANMFAYRAAWNVGDDTGHGTEMAGLALYGDLVPQLLSKGPIPLEHGLESVKILPPPGLPANPPELYGAITSDAVGQVEVAAPDRKRTFALSVTALDARDRGQPSSWSAELDQIASGALDGQRRLICVAAGNSAPTNRHLYFANPMTDEVHDPGQSWNALTVGACTDKVRIDDPDYDGWQPVAPAGDLSPSSTTSVTWKPKWPIKPDVVIEGGNVALEPGAPNTATVDSLSLLTTNWKPEEATFTYSGETSGATAQAARMAALVQVRYPTLWPETIRGLLVHSARWTRAMLARFPSKPERSKLLRCYGYGVPSLDRACWSASDSLTLIAQNELQPYEKVKSSYRTRDMHLYALPWPREALLELRETQVDLRVTLSYFIEPNPGRRGWKDRYRYASHGLRFDVNTPEEGAKEFGLRINKAARDEEAGLKKTTSSDASKWSVGPDLRATGSVHSDVWRGDAAKLATRGLVAVFPVIGWWRERTSLSRWDSKARYSLIVSIHTPELAADIYTPVATALAVTTAVTV